jgi:hypothetical protein
MIDRLFTAALTFALLAGGTAAVGSALLGSPAHPEAGRLQAQVKRLPNVEVVVERQRVARSASELAARVQ